MFLVLDAINEEIKKDAIEIGIEEVIQSNIDNEEFLAKVRELLSFKN